jgi:lysozyme family protein
MFANIMSFVLKWEGGYVNHPSDPGGATNMGITQKTLDRYCDRKEIARFDVRDIKVPMVMNIYYEDYWKPEWEKLGMPLATCMMDTAVNMGESRANAFLKGCNGDYVQFLQLRLAKYKELITNNPSLKAFEKGWNNRMTDLRRFIDNDKASDWARAIHALRDSVGRR